MHHRHLLIAGLLLLCLITGIPLLFMASNRTEQAATPETAVQNVAYNQPLTVGVILSGQADRFGWPDLNGAEYAETHIGDNRIILYDELNATVRPSVRLEDVVAEMVNRGAGIVFISAGHVAGAEGIRVDEKYVNTVFIMNLAMRDDVAALLEVLPSTAPDVAQPITTGSSSTSTPETGPRDIGPVVGLITLVIVLLAAGVVLASWWSGFTLTPEERKTGKKKRALAGVHGKALAIEDAARGRITNFEVLGESEPLVHKLSTYVHGDKHFDESFQIEKGKGKVFLGQCGIGPAERVNQYERDKIAAFEVWVFDKNDVRTVTHLLVSEYASRSQAFQTLLATKGELVLTEPDAVTTLETKTLRVQVRVLDMQYGFSDTLPQRSFFEHLVVEFAVWEKP